MTSYSRRLFSSESPLVILKSLACITLILQLRMTGRIVGLVLTWVWELGHAIAWEMQTFWFRE